MSIRTQLTIAVGGLVVAIVLISAGTLAATFKYSTEVATFAPLAARVQALSQQAAKEALLFDQSQDEKAASQLRSTAEELGASLSGMINGGDVVISDGEMLTIEPINDTRAVEKAELTQQQWTPIAGAIEKFIASGGDDHESLDFIIVNSKGMTSAAGALGKRLTDIVRERSMHMMIIQGLILLFSIVAGIFTTVIGTRLSHSLEVLTEHADMISQGASDQPVPTNGPGEVGKLGKSLDRMRISLNKALKMISETQS